MSEYDKPPDKIEEEDAQTVAARRRGFVARALGALGGVALGGSLAGCLPCLRIASAQDANASDAGATDAREQ